MLDSGTLERVLSSVASIVPISMPTEREYRFLLNFPSSSDVRHFAVR